LVPVFNKTVDTDGKTLIEGLKKEIIDSVEQVNWKVNQNNFVEYCSTIV
jgi:hypothetical protein